MNYINKSELKKLLVNELKSKYQNIGFKFLSSKNRFYKQVEGGLVMFDYTINNSYNFEKDEVALRVEISFFVGFEVVHKWFENFEHRSKKDYKYYWTYGNNLDDIAKSKFQIDIDEVNINGFLIDLVKEIDNSFRKFYKANRSLDNLAKNKIPSCIKTIEDVKGIKSFNVRTAIEFLTIAWILKRDDFNQMLALFKEKIEELVDVGDPMAKNYYPKFDEIIEALKNINLSNPILCLEDNAI